MSAGRPFLFDDVFAINRDLKIDSAGIDDIPAVIVEDYLGNPEEARSVTGDSPATNWKTTADGFNFVDYFDCRLRIPVVFPCPLVDAARHIVHKVYAVETKPQNPCVDINWFKQIKPRRADFAVPHHDVVGDSPRSFTCLIYLNLESECSGGTSFFRFRGSGSLVLDRAFDETARADPGIVETGRDYWPGNPDKYWERVGNVDMVPGRLMIFPSEFFHAAWHPTDSFELFPRLTLAFWLHK
jgi:hypothetical protein